MIALQVNRRPAGSKELEHALGQLDAKACAYFGCDAGIPGLHPLQATLLDKPALSLSLFADGLEIQALSGMGHALLAHPALSAWPGLAQRGHGQHPLTSLRVFMAAFAPLHEVLLLGALPFNAHRLAAEQPVRADEPLGRLFFGEHYWQRGSDGQWQRIELTLPNPEASTPPLQATPVGLTAHARPRAADPHDDYPPGGYAEMVRRALVFLREQALVSLTLSQSFRRRASVSPSQAFARLCRMNPAPATFFLNDGHGECLFGASPDLQLIIRRGEIEALPVCGTVARGPGPVGEAESFRELLNEKVDAASLAVCTDALRNDLAPLCEPGSLRLMDRRRPMSLSTVVHTVDRLGGRLRATADAWDAILATAAPVMVTGTPRHLALAAIDLLEASPRGWYGGLMVLVRADGDALAGTLLRAAALHAGIAEVRTGGDLMADSNPEREENESRLKAISLWRALGIAESPSPTARSPVPASVTRLPARIALHDAGDPFPAAVRDTLEGLGLTLDASANLTLLIGSDATACRAFLDSAAKKPLIAMGDAALHVLQHAGFAIDAVAPVHGRLLTCAPTALAPWEHDGPFTAAGYSSLALTASTVLPGWEVWAHDENLQPVLLVNGLDRIACLLFRADSLLSSVPALEALKAALRHIAMPADPGCPAPFG